MRGLIGLLRAVLTLALAAALLLGAWFFLSAQVFGVRAPALFGVSVTAVEDETMAPALRTGDLVLLREPEAYALGDIAACEEDGALRVVRIVGRVDGSCIVRGDGEDQTRERLLDPDALAGRLWLALPGGAAPAAFFSSLPGLLLLLALLLAVLLLPLLMGTGRETAPSRRSRRG